MAFNLNKKYPELLEILHFNQQSRDFSLRRIFDRDIQDNNNFCFKDKLIHPIKDKDGMPSMDTLFNHLTRTKTEETDQEGKTINRRVEFESDRSIRLHWIKHHIDEKIVGIDIFSITERDKKKREDVIKTYIYNKPKKYVVVLECQRSKNDYYLLSAYYLNKIYGEKDIQRKMKNKLNDII
ncbi:MAG: hypothetical protein WC135_05895 [Bacteroidales bacterium]